jgi:hypothetical protein
MRFRIGFNADPDPALLVNTDQDKNQDLNLFIFQLFTAVSLKET